MKVNSQATSLAESVEVIPDSSAIGADCSSLGFDDRDPHVSTLSRFYDSAWDFRKEIASPTQDQAHKIIRWDFEVIEGVSFSEPKYSSLQLACKQFLYAMLHHPESNRTYKPLTVLLNWIYVRRFVVFIVKRKVPVLSFSEVNKYITDEYIKYLKSLAGEDNNGNVASTLYIQFRALKLLYLYRTKLFDSIQFDPFSGTTPGKEAGYTREYVQKRRTEFIPDEVLSTLITKTLYYVNHFGDYLVEAARFTLKRRENKKSTAPYHVNKYLKKKTHATVQEMDGTPLHLSITGLRELEHYLIRLRTACLILIAFVTGIRISELLSLEAGCIEVEATKKEGDYIWIWSLLHKTQQREGGTRSKWLGGPIAKTAVDLLEKLTEPTRLTFNCQSLFVSVTKAGIKRWAGEGLSSSIFYRDLEDYVNWLDLKDNDGKLFYLHPHMFRRTFARHVVRCDTTNLLALKEHFKHWSLAMTDIYVGVDAELQDLLDSENDLLNFESFDKVLRSDRLAGPRGSQVLNMINTAIADGRLPAEFRGAAGGQYRRKMIKEMIEAGQQVYPAGAGNFCWFQMDKALCTKSQGPVVERCNPVGCPNSVILPEHLPHWERIANDSSQILKLNPAGEPYRQRLVHIQRIGEKVVKDLCAWSRD